MRPPVMRAALAASLLNSLPLALFPLAFGPLALFPSTAIATSTSSSPSPFKWAPKWAWDWRASNRAPLAQPQIQDQTQTQVQDQTQDQPSAQAHVQTQAQDQVQAPAQASPDQRLREDAVGITRQKGTTVPQPQADSIAEIDQSRQGRRQDHGESLGSRHGWADDAVRLVQDDADDSLQQGKPDHSLRQGKADDSLRQGKADDSLRQGKTERDTSRSSHRVHKYHQWHPYDTEIDHSPFLQRPKQEQIQNQDSGQHYSIIYRTRSGTVHRVPQHHVLVDEEPDSQREDLDHDQDLIHGKHSKHDKYAELNAYDHDEMSRLLEQAQDERNHHHQHHYRYGHGTGPSREQHEPSIFFPDGVVVPRAQTPRNHRRPESRQRNGYSHGRSNEQPNERRSYRDSDGQYGNQGMFHDTRNTLNIQAGHDEQHADETLGWLHHGILESLLHISPKESQEQEEDAIQEIRPDDSRRSNSHARHSNTHTRQSNTDAHARQSDTHTRQNTHASTGRGSENARQSFTFDTS